ncbi:hypothetical protein [Streptomyces sp. ALB3]
MPMHYGVVLWQQATEALLDGEGLRTALRHASQARTEEGGTS